MTINLPSRTMPGHGPEPRRDPPIPPASAVALWWVATPGVCRLVDDPERLVRLLRLHPEARVTRMWKERPV